MNTASRMLHPTCDLEAPGTSSLWGWLDGPPCAALGKPLLNALFPRRQNESALLGLPPVGTPTGKGPVELGEPWTSAVQTDGLQSPSYSSGRETVWKGFEFTLGKYRGRERDDDLC